MPWYRIVVESAMTIAGKEAREPANRMPGTIMVGDIVRLRDGKVGLYARFYGRDMEDKTWPVIFIDRVNGKKRLIVADTPSAIYVSHARLAYKPQSKTRRDILTAAGVKL